MVQPNVSEDLVEECCKQHEDDVAAFRATRYRELDASGVDLIITFKIRVKSHTEKIAFPMDMKVQVKTSDNLETVGVVWPLSAKFLEKNSKRISSRMEDRIKKHIEKHPLVPCMIFVSQLKDGKTREAVLEEIWRELQAIRRYIARYCFRFLDK